MDYISGCCRRDGRAPFRYRQNGEAEVRLFVRSQTPLFGGDFAYNRSVLPRVDHGFEVSATMAAPATNLSSSCCRVCKSRIACSDLMLANTSRGRRTICPKLHVKPSCCSGRSNGPESRHQSAPKRQLGAQVGSDDKLGTMSPDFAWPYCLGTVSTEYIDIPHRPAFLSSMEVSSRRPRMLLRNSMRNALRLPTPI